MAPREEENYDEPPGEDVEMPNEDHSSEEDGIDLRQDIIDNFFMSVADTIRRLVKLCVETAHLREEKKAAEAAAPTSQISIAQTFTPETDKNVVYSHQKAKLWRTIAQKVHSVGVSCQHSHHCRKQWQDLRSWTKKSTRVQLGLSPPCKASEQASGGSSGKELGEAAGKTNSSNESEQEGTSGTEGRVIIRFSFLSRVASLRCYSCMDVGGGGCAADLIKIEQCTAPQNICLEAISVVSVGKQNVSATIRGCDVGTISNVTVSTDSSVTSYDRHKLHACSEDLCNMLVTEDFLHKPQANQTGNSASVPGDQECYSCISTLEDQCSSQKAAVVRCPKQSGLCYQGNGEVVLGFHHNITLSFFIRECSGWGCSGGLGVSTQFLDYKKTGSCCLGNLCNAARPNGGLREATYVVPLIMAALLAITSL
ncbi:uncharacterized protein LOC144769706 [Lissotriton helveticus]